LYDPAKQSERVKQLTEKYIKNIESKPIEELIFIDESGAILNMTLPYGRSLKGKRAFDSCPVSKGKRISTIGALSTDGLVANMVMKEHLMGPIFVFFGEFFSSAVKKR